MKASEEGGGSPEVSTPGSSGSGGGSRPSSARRVHRHSSSGNVMLDQLLKDLGNRLTIAEDVRLCHCMILTVVLRLDFLANYTESVCIIIVMCVILPQTSSTKAPLKGVQLASTEDVRHKNWLSMYRIVCHTIYCRIFFLPMPHLYLDKTAHIVLYSYCLIHPICHPVHYLHKKRTIPFILFCEPFLLPLLPLLPLHISLPPVTLTNIQVALKGIETSGYVVASSNKAQIFGQEHQPVLKEGDLVAKKSWLACVGKLQVGFSFTCI